MNGHYEHEKVMNLQDHIVWHIFQCFGMFGENSKLNTCKSILDKKFLVEKKMRFEDDDGKVSEHEIYSACGKIDKSSINILLVNLSDPEQFTKEYVMFFRMDAMPTYVLEGCYAVIPDTETRFDSSFSIVIDDKYIPATMALQASFLSGTENMFELFIDWTRQDKYDDIYDVAIKYFR